MYTTQTGKKKLVEMLHYSIFDEMETLTRILFSININCHIDFVTVTIHLFL